METRFSLWKAHVQSWRYTKYMWLFSRLFSVFFYDYLTSRTNGVRLFFNFLCRGVNILFMLSVFISVYCVSNIIFISVRWCRVLQFNKTGATSRTATTHPITSHRSGFKGSCCWIFCFLCILCRSLIVIFAFWHMNCLSFHLRFVFIPIYRPWVTEWLRSLTTKPKYLTYNTTDTSSAPDTCLPHLHVII